MIFRAIRAPLAVLALATSTAACSPPARAAAPAATQEPARPGRLVVTGTATVEVVPDCLDVTLVLSSEGERPRSAIRALRARQEVLIQALVAAGVARSDVKLSGLVLSPLRDEKGRPRGYGASIRVVASTKQLDLVGDLMEAASEAGTQSMSTDFRVTDLPAVKKKVRELALQAAAEKAHMTVATLGARLGKVVEVAESAGEWNPGAGGNSYVASAPGGAAMGPEAEPLTMSINVTYELG
jgi:uncharacterized protein YggE